jgi:hypothetical protein
MKSYCRADLDAALLSRLCSIVPADSLRAEARQAVVAYDEDRPVGVVFVRTIAGIPNVTWLVAEAARRRGLAVEMLRRLQQDWRYLTAICRTPISTGVARRAGFQLLGPLALWVR